ncbi:BOI-related E3 ubiquitin-protein ligase 1 [Canna indica]|uniref:BOI-related E3 ubiquitin-protein ligase 1 n=1 Tax=Canna indica TaxID=4628 RepID=A0AAQ3KBH5_9LILI|nr:BOI-related E3 ubiquitin-protein ligase 1 [Canna indica]
MAVQAQYPSNYLLLNRSEKERKEIESSSPAATGFLAQPAVFVTDGANGNPRKRERDAAGVPMAAEVPQQQQMCPVNFISLQPKLCAPGLVSLAKRPMHSPPGVSTGLGLAPENKQNSRNREQSILFDASSSCPSLFSDELAAQINRQRDEIEQFVLAQGEQLRRALSERRQAHYRTLLSVAQESAARRLQGKEVEVERATRRRAELEDRLARLRTESMAWQAKAMADQSRATALHAQLQQAAAAAAAATPPGTGGACCDPPTAEDAGSACMDPRRAEGERQKTCRSCQWRQASTVLLPCRHLCLCDACDAATESCPICCCVRTGSVRVFFC